MAGSEPPTLSSAGRVIRPAESGVHRRAPQLEPRFRWGGGGVIALLGGGLAVLSFVLVSHFLERCDQKPELISGPSPSHGTASDPKGEPEVP